MKLKYKIEIPPKVGVLGNKTTIVRVYEDRTIITLLYWTGNKESLDYRRVRVLGTAHTTLVAVLQACRKTGKPMEQAIDDAYLTQLIRRAGWMHFN